jgi:Bacteriophage head to tail connecting protein
MRSARQRYHELTSGRTAFLDIALECAKLTIPTLLMHEETTTDYTRFKTPWQSVGAKGVVTLASKLMLGLLPPSTSFFKLQLDDSKLGVEIPAEAKSELDLSFAKIERMIMDSIAASTDRVQIFSAIKHLVVTGNALLYMGKDGMKMYPLNRYVVERDGNGNVTEIVTRERVNRKMLGPAFENPQQLNVVDTSSSYDKDVDVYTCIKLTKKGWTWYQEADDKLLPNSYGKAPKDRSPWLPLRFVTVDGEDYGRSRVEEFLGDLRSLEALMQALVEGSAAAAKVIFTVSPSSTTKPASLANAGNGAIIQGRPDDIGVVQVGKTADFRTAFELAGVLEKRISEAFLILSVRQSERTTAEEVRMTQMELEQQLGGLFSLLTSEFLIPYLNRKMLDLTKAKQIPSLPKGLVNPTIVAGINALGRGQDRESLIQFVTTIAQTMGPEALQQFLNPDEAIKRLAAAQGIDVLNLVKSMEQISTDRQQAMQKQMQMSMVNQTSQLLSTPLMDPAKNPQAVEAVQAAMMNPAMQQGLANLSGGQPPQQPQGTEPVLPQPPG